MPARKHIGLEIGDTEFRLVELRADDDGPVLANARVQQTEYNFGSTLIHDAPYNRTIAKAFIRDLTALFNGGEFQAPSVSIAIPASAILVATIPVEPRSTTAEKHEQLQWECRTLYGFDTDVEIDVRSVVIGATEDTEQHLVAAMPVQTNTFFHSVFRQLGYTINDLDIDHFVMENCIAGKMDGADARTYAVAGLYEEFCSIGVYSKGDYRGFRQGQVSFSEGYFAQTLRLLQQVIETEPAAGLEAVFAFGSATTKPLLDSLRELLNIPVARFEPLKGMPHLTPAVSDSVAGIAPHVFDIPAGAAILGMQ